MLAGSITSQPQINLARHPQVQMQMSNKFKEQGFAARRIPLSKSRTITNVVRASAQ